ncbi:MAG TPA: hypothetical protein VJ768_11885 [Anaerolineales bacterium]|nr:hypothetical protein [Anaerolineales bacterium]
MIFIFLDGVGLGPDDPEVNPFAGVEMPVMESLLGGRMLAGCLSGVAMEKASAFGLDPLMGIDDTPQSATGQASFLTGKRVPELIGYHYGPKPNPEIAALIKDGNIFSRIVERGRRAALLNAYPPRYFQSIASGYRLYSAIPLAVTSAGIPLMGMDDFYESRALSADFTGEAWRTFLGFPDAPLRSDAEAGVLLAELACSYELTFFEFWITDLLGHRQDMDGAMGILERFDRVLGGLTENVDPGDCLILITSDHGNLEDLSTRRHTKNQVPVILIGSPELREEFGSRLKDLADISTQIEGFLL